MHGNSASSVFFKLTVEEGVRALDEFLAEMDHDLASGDEPLPAEAEASYSREYT